MRWVGVSDDLYTVEPDGRNTVLLGDYGLKCLELEEVNKQLKTLKRRVA